MKGEPCAADFLDDVVGGLAPDEHDAFAALTHRGVGNLGA
jgi:hypothetical protein